MTRFSVSSAILTEISGSIPFGRAQKPELWDYADGVDTMEFSIKLISLVAMKNVTPITKDDSFGFRWH